MIDGDEALTKIWSAGRIAIVGTFAEGPEAGSMVVCATDRMAFLRHVQDVSRSMQKYPGFVPSVQTHIRSQVLKGVAKLTPKNDADFMNDLALLMCIKIISRSDAALKDAGLFALALSISSDTSLPWDKRGLLRAEDVDAKVTEVA